MPTFNTKRRRQSMPSSNLLRSRSNPALNLLGNNSGLHTTNQFSDTVVYLISFSDDLIIYNTFLISYRRHCNLCYDFYRFHFLAPTLSLRLPIKCMLLPRDFTPTTLKVSIVA